MKWKSSFLCFVLAAVLFGACRSVPDSILKDKELNDFVKAPLFGMIYDDRNRPCQGVSVSIMEFSPAGTEREKEPLRNSVYTDINGRFVLTDMRRGSYRILAEKKGFEPTEAVFDFTNRNQVLYIQIISFESLLYRAEESLKTNDYPSALNYLERAGRLEEKHPAVLYMKAVCYYNGGKFDDAETLLLEVEAQGNGNFYTFLLLADVYGFGLKKRDSELLYLKKAYNIYADEEIKRRME